MGINTYNMEKAKNKIKNNDNISEKNKELILKHDEELELNNFSDDRRYKYLTRLPYLAEEIDKPFEELKKEDVKKKIVLYLHRRDDINSTTKADYKVLFKRFMKFLNDGEYPDSVKWISTDEYNKTDDLNPADMLKEDDIIELSEACTNPRDKALIHFLFEVGLRVSELLELKLKHFEDAQQYLKVHIPPTKTKSRDLFIVTSVPYVNRYLSYHPRNNGRDSAFLVNIGNRNKGKPMEYPAVRKRLRDIRADTDIKKAVNPHFFRKSSATFKAAKGWSEYELCSWFGWKTGSQVVQKYIAASGRTSIDRKKKQHGIEDEESTKPKLTPDRCPRCKEPLEEGISFCPNCGFALTKESAEKIEESEEKLQKSMEKTEDSAAQSFVKELKKNPELMEKFQKMMEDE